MVDGKSVSPEKIYAHSKLELITVYCIQLLVSILFPLFLNTENYFHHKVVPIDIDCPLDPRNLIQAEG